MPTVKGRLSSAVRLALGAILLYGGLTKVGATAEFAETISNYRLLPTSSHRFIAVLVPTLEITSGVSLILNFWARAAAWLALGQSLAFGIFVTSALLRGLDVECGCFSGASKVSWYHVGFDLAMLLAACFVLRTNVENATNRSNNSSATSDRFARNAALVLFVINLASGAWLISAAKRQASSKAEPSTIASNIRNPRPPLIFLEPSALDLGLVRQEDEASGTVQIQNQSNDSVAITDIESSCGCTVPEIEKRVLAPGESTKMKVLFHPKGNRGTSTQTVQISFDKSPPLTLVVRAEIDTAVEAIPSIVEIGQREEVIVRLASRRPGHEVSVTGVASPFPSLRVSPSGATRGSEVSVLLFLDGTIPPEQTGKVWTVQFRLVDGPPCLLYVKERDT